MRDKLEKNLKRWLKGRMKLSLGTMIAFLLTGIASYSAESDIFLSVGKGFDFNKKFEDSNFNLETETYVNNSILSSYGYYNSYQDNVFKSALTINEARLNFINNSIIEYDNLDSYYNYQDEGLRYTINGITSSFINNGTIISYNDKSNVTGTGSYTSADGRLGGIRIYSNSFINNGLISSKEILKNKKSDYGEHGIINQFSSGNNGITWSNENGEIQDGIIINNGSILVFTTANMEKETTNGVTSFFKSTNGILNDSDKLSIDNKGMIKGFALGNGNLPEEVKFSKTGNGIVGQNLNIKNQGTILGYINSLYEYSVEYDTGNSGNGISIYNEEGEDLSNVENKGLISGNEFAIAIKDSEKSNPQIKNYGIMAGKEILGNGKQGEDFAKIELPNYENYGINIITEQKKNGNKTTTEIKEVIVADKEIKLDDYTILNAQLIPSFNDLTYSFKFDNNSIIEKNILNGVDKTLVVRTGETNTFKESIINSFKSAIDMHNNSTLILENSVINGGADISSTYNEETKEFTINSTPTINITGDNTNLVLKNTLINGDMKASGKDNFLTLENMYIYHNVDGFENMIVNGNTTLSEEAKITGTDTITISKDGTLTLSLKSTNQEIEGIKKVTHSLNNGEHILIQGEGNGVDTAGTLKFQTNGIGKQAYVDMTDVELKNLYIKTSSVIDKAEVGEGYVILGAGTSLDEIFNKDEVNTPEIPESGGGEPEKPTKPYNYEKLDSIYKGIYSSSDENLDMLRNIIGNSNLGGSYEENNDEEQLKVLMKYLSNIYTATPYSFSSEASRKSMNMFADIVKESSYKANKNENIIYGGLTHAQLDRDTELFGKNYHGFDTNKIGINGDIKSTGAYGVLEHGLTDNISLGALIGGNKHDIDVDSSSSKGTSAYLGTYIKHDIDNVRNILGAGVQYTEYDTTRDNLGYKYSGDYSDISFNLYGQTKYSHKISDSLYIEPSLSLNYSYIMQDDIQEEKQPLSLEIKSKDFSILDGKIGIDLKKEIVTSKGKHNLIAGVNYTRILSGADEESLEGNFGGSSFELLIPHKTKDNLSLGLTYQVEENGYMYHLTSEYTISKDSTEANKNSDIKEWTVGVGLGYKF